MQIRAGLFPETIRAVVAGVGSCADPQLSDLPAIPREAAAVCEALVSPHACRVPAEQVRCLNSPADITRSEILSALEKCAASAAPGDIIVFYFAGHGLDRGSSFALVPYDGMGAKPETLITAEDIGTALAGTQARGVFMVADCCGGAAIYENARALFGKLGDRLEFRILLSSSKRGESSWEIAGRGSPFTEALVEALQGRLAGIGKQGEIYFTDLMAHVTSRVEELLEGKYSGLPPQHPSFEGSYQKDPLLFVNSDIAIGRLVLKTERYSPEFVRRRVRLAVGSVVAILGIAAVGYWTWLDQHSYFKLNDNNLTLYQGRPGHSAFGMPRRLWEFSIFRELVDPASELGRDGELILGKERNLAKLVESVLPSLTLTGKISLLTQSGQPDEARKLARAALTSGKDLGLARNVVVAAYASSERLEVEDKDFLAKLIRDDFAGADAAAALPVLLRVDSELALKSLRGSRSAQNPIVLRALDALQPPCSAQTRVFLHQLFNNPRPFLAELGMHGWITAGCSELKTPFLGMRSSRIKTLAYFRRTHSEEHRAKFVELVLEEIEAESERKWKGVDDDEFIPVLIGQLAFLGPGPCKMDLITQTDWAPELLRLDIFEYLLNSCAGLSFRISLAGDEETRVVVVDLLTGETVESSAEVEVHASDSNRNRILDFIQRRAAITDFSGLIEEPISIYRARRAQWDATDRDRESAVNALMWAAQLKYWSEAIGALAVANEAIPIRKWALLATLRANPEPGTDILVERFGDFSSDFFDFLKMIAVADLPESSLKKLLARAKQADEADWYRISLTSLYGTADEAVRLLTSPAAAHRSAAGTLIAFREDLAEILAAIRRSPPAFEPSILDVLGSAAKQRDYLTQLVKDYPDPLIDWRVAIMGPMIPQLMDGIRLAALKEIVRGKSRGIERPFFYWMVQFSTWQ